MFAFTVWREKVEIYVISGVKSVLCQKRLEWKDQSMKCGNNSGTHQPGFTGINYYESIILCHCDMRILFESYLCFRATGGHSSKFKEI